MTVASPHRWITRVENVWLLPPFKKALAKRERETVLLGQLAECIDLLYRDPTSPGLNLETLAATGRCPILSARIDQGHRLLLTPLTGHDVGLLHFDAHDQAYQWVRKHEASVPTMLTRVERLERGARLGQAPLLAAVRADEESPVGLASAEQFRQMLAEGIGRYLAHLDDEQRQLAELQTRGLLLVKGGAGTGKTAVAIHRALNAARQPPLLGVRGVLYLCYNRALARVVEQIVRTLGYGAAPPELEVQTFHAWCRAYLERRGYRLVVGSRAEPAGKEWPERASNGAGRLLVVDDERCRGLVYRAFGELAPEDRAKLAPLDGRFVDEEIEQVLQPNGLASLAEYLEFNRQGRKVGLKWPQREAVWRAHERAQELARRQEVCRWSDLPLLALAALDDDPERPQYRAIVIDEAQDCSPVMVRLARRLLAESGSLTVFADPAQAIYDCGFQWTQRELRPAGGNVRWLRRTYRSTEEIFDLARALLDRHDDLAEELANLERPARRGPRPALLAAAAEEELHGELVERIVAEAAERPAHQIGVLAPRWQTLERIAERLERRGVKTQLLRSESGPFRIEEPSVKLATFQSAKGLDFPSVYVVGPTRRDLGGEARADAPETRRALYVALTRASERLVIGLVYGEHHPLLEELDDAHYEPQGSQARPFVNTRALPRR